MLFNIHILKIELSIDVSLNLQCLVKHILSYNKTLNCATAQHYSYKKLTSNKFEIRHLMSARVNLHFKLI